MKFIPQNLELSAKAIVEVIVASTHVMRTYFDEFVLTKPFLVLRVGFHKAISGEFLGRGRLSPIKMTIDVMAMK